MYKCPECGSEFFKESRQCPKHKGTPICISCCYKCEHYSKDKNNLYICRFYINNPHLRGIPTRQEELKNIEKIKRRLEQKDI